MALRPCITTGLPLTVSNECIIANNLSTGQGIFKYSQK
jgi:hypothetical protein